MAFNDSSLAYQRKRYGLTQSELASRVGCSRNTISSIENGSEPSVGLAIRLASALLCPVEYLFEEYKGDWEPDYSLSLLLRD